MHNKKINEVGLETYSLNPHEWVHKYGDFLYAYAITRVNDEEQVKDLVQETFLAAVENIEKFEGRSSEKTWLTSILKNKIFDLYRAKSSPLSGTTILSYRDPDSKFFRPEDGHWKDEYRPKEFAIKTPDVIENKELRGILQGCLKKLPALWMTIFKMKFMEEHNSKVICKELEITPSNYWVIIHRAKVNLRACLQKNWM